MKIRVLTIMAHPAFGTAEPGTVLDLPEADAAVLLTSGMAERVDPVKHESAFESAKLDEHEHETAMHAPPRGKTTAR